MKLYVVCNSHSNSSNAAFQATTIETILANVVAVNGNGIACFNFGVCAV